MKKNNPKHNRRNKFKFAKIQKGKYSDMLQGIGEIFDVIEVNNIEGFIPYDDIEDVKSFLWRVLITSAFTCEKVSRNSYNYQITGPELCPTFDGAIPNDHIILNDINRGEFMHQELVDAKLIEDWMVLSFPINLKEKGTINHPFKLFLGNKEGQNYFMVDLDKINNCTHIKVEFTEEEDINKIKNNYYKMIN